MVTIDDEIRRTSMHTRGRTMMCPRAAMYGNVQHRNSQYDDAVCERCHRNQRA